jgi:two-component system, cell cycle sensor histidine kinase and response regulator CckA
LGFANNLKFILRTGISVQEMTVDIWLTVALGTIALLAIAIGFVATVMTSKQKELQSKKKQLEELTLSERKYKNLFEYSPAGMLRLKINSWDVLDANKVLLHIFQVDSSSEVKNILFTMPSPDREFIDKQLSAEGSAKDFETVLSRKDGSNLWISISATSVANENHFEAAIIDVTARRQTEERVREQAKLLDQAHDGILVLDLEGTILYWNKGAERLYQYRSSDVIGKKVSDYIYSPDQTKGFQSAFELVLQNSEWSGELNQKKQNGSVVVTDCRWTLVRNSKNEPSGILQVCTDVTERKRLEARSLKAQRLESIGIFASGIAHDLNNALAPVLIGIGVLRRKLQDQQSRRLLKSIESSAKYGTEMVYRVLSFVKGIEGTHALLNPRKIVKDIANQLNHIIPDNVSIQTRLAENLPNIMGDATQLQQVLLNLCTNARDAMPKGGELTFSVSDAWVDWEIVEENPDAREGEYVMFSIADTGVGIPYSEIHKIFEPFYTTKELGKGTGLGLSVSLGIVKGHKGFMTVESIEGKGSTFKIYIPINSASKTNSEEKIASKQINKQIIFFPSSEDLYSKNLLDGLEDKGYEVQVAVNKSKLKKNILQFTDVDYVLVFDGFLIDITPSLMESIRILSAKVKFIILADLQVVEEIKKIKLPKFEAVLTRPVSFESFLKTLNGIAK